MKINTEKAYLLGLLIGGGIIHDRSLQIILPYKKWGDLKINPGRAGEIAEDILARMQPLWKTHYNMDVYYKIGTDWKVVCNTISSDLINDLMTANLPIEGELRCFANLESLLPLLLRCSPFVRQNFALIKVQSLVYFFLNSLKSKKPRRVVDETPVEMWVTPLLGVATQTEVARSYPSYPWAAILQV